MDLQLARAVWARARADVAEGRDPAAEAKVAVAVKVEARSRERTLASSRRSTVLRSMAGRSRPRAKRDEKRQIGQALELSGAAELPPGELRRNHVMRLLDAAEGPAQAAQAAGQLVELLAPTWLTVICCWPTR